MVSSNYVSIKAMYDARSLTYDKQITFHQKQAQDYLTYANPQAGYHCLDLATGTGLVAFNLAKAVDPTGSVIGIDLSPGMLSLAQQKKLLPENSHLNIEFIEGDITNLDSVPELRGKEGTFDLITCAAALVLLQDIPAAIKGWMRFLKPGGKLVTDVPLPNAMIGNKILDKIATRFEDENLESSRRRFRSNREWILSLDSLRKIFQEAGMQIENALETGDYRHIPARTKTLLNGPKCEWRVEDAGKLFDELAPLNVEDTGSLWDLSKRDQARSEFEQEFKKYADKDGMVREAFRFYICVGKKL